MGQYAYTVDGTSPASITMVPDRRTVTLTASSHTIKRGARLHLDGLLSYGIGSPPPTVWSFTDMPVMVLARHDRHHPFRQIATGSLAIRLGDTDGWPWWLDLHPQDDDHLHRRSELRARLRSCCQLQRLAWTTTLKGLLMASCQT